MLAYANLQRKNVTLLDDDASAQSGCITRVNFQISAPPPGCGPPGCPQPPGGPGVFNPPPRGGGPPGGGVLQERVNGLEPSTFSLEGYQHRMEVSHEQEPTDGSANACANACTDDTYSSKSEAAENAMHHAHMSAGVRPDLQRVIDAWPALPPAVRHGLLTIIDAVGGEPDEARR